MFLTPTAQQSFYVRFGCRCLSPLSVDDFVKKSSLIAYTEKDLREAWPDVVRFAEHEGLTAHANSVQVRFAQEGESNEPNG